MTVSIMETFGNFDGNLNKFPAWKLLETEKMNILKYIQKNVVSWKLSWKPQVSFLPPLLGGETWKLFGETR